MSEPQSIRDAMAGSGVSEAQREALRSAISKVPSDLRLALHGVPEAYQFAILTAWGAHQFKWQKLAKRWGCTPQEAEARARAKWERIARERAAAEEKRWREAQAAKEKPNSTRSPQW